MDVAFRNPDGSTVLVAHNENDNPQHVRRARGRTRRSATPCPAGRWPRSPGAAPCPARARCARSTRPGGPRRRTRPGPPTRAARATWRPTPSTMTPAPGTPPGPGRRPGQYLQVDFGRRHRCPAGGVRHRRVHRRLPAWLHGHDQHRRDELDRRGGRCGHRQFTTVSLNGAAGPVRPDDADRVQRQLVERRRRPRLHGRGRAPVNPVMTERGPCSPRRTR